MSKLIIIRGYPGSGKTTLGKALQGAGHGKFIDHNQILTFIASIVGDDDGIYDDIASLEQAMTRKLLKQGHDVIVARGFSSAGSIREYEDIARSLSSGVVIIRLETPIDILAQRVQSPERSNDFNPTVTPEALLEWVDSSPIQAIENEVVLDASQPVDTVVQQAIQVAVDGDGKVYT